MASGDSFTFYWEPEYANTGVGDEEGIVRYMHHDAGTNAYSYLWMQCDNS